VPHAPALDPLFALLAERVPRLPRKRRKKLALAYLALDGDNDDDAELDAFAARVSAIDPALTVHLYAHNAVPTSARRGVSRARYEAMYERLVRAGLERVRMSSKARLEPNGGCGTLVALRRRALSIA
jgi:23S rRNA (adenine2503-C2)-methyltransferase